MFIQTATATFPPFRAAHILEIRALSPRDVYLRVYWPPVDYDNSSATAISNSDNHDHLSNVEGEGEGGDMENRKKKRKERRWLEMGIVDAAEVRGRA